MSMAFPVPGVSPSKMRTQLKLVLVLSKPRVPRLRVFLPCLDCCHENTHRIYDASPSLRRESTCFASRHATLLAWGTTRNLDRIPPIHMMPNTTTLTDTTKRAKGKGKGTTAIKNREESKVNQNSRSNSAGFACTSHEVHVPPWLRRQARFMHPSLTASPSTRPFPPFGCLEV